MAISLQNIPPIVKASTTSITLAATYEGAQSIARIGGKYYRLSSTLTLNTGSIGLGGLDAGSLGASQTWYVYLCANSASAVGLVASQNLPTTGPSGFSGRYNLIGKFTTTSGSLIDVVYASAEPIDVSSISASSGHSWAIGGPGNPGFLNLTATSGAVAFKIGNTVGNTAFEITVTENSSVIFDVYEGTQSRDIIFRQGTTLGASVATCVNGVWTFGVTNNNAVHTFQSGGATQLRILGGNGASNAYIEIGQTPSSPISQWAFGYNNGNNAFEFHQGASGFNSNMVGRISATGLWLLGPSSGVANGFHLVRGGSLALEHAGAGDRGIGLNCFFDATRNWNRTSTTAIGGAITFNPNPTNDHHAITFYANQVNDNGVAADVVGGITGIGRWVLGTLSTAEIGSQLVGIGTGAGTLGGIRVRDSGTVGDRFVIENTGNMTNGNRLTLYGTYATSSNQWSFAHWYSGNSNSNPFLDLELNFRGDGSVLSDGAYSGAGADYAEYFESTDGEPIAPGTSVVLENGKVRAATVSDEEDDIVGIVRPKNGASVTIGNAAGNGWHGKWQRDAYGGVILDGNQRRQYSQDYDPEETYVPREQREEWQLIGLMGQIPMTKNQPVNPTWRKMKDINASVELWFVR